MSFDIAYTRDGVAVLAAERRVTLLSERITFDGPSKLAGVEGGFVCGMGNGDAGALFRVAMQKHDNVSAEQLAHTARMAAGLLPRTDGLPLLVTAILRRTNGVPRIVKYRSDTDALEDGEQSATWGCPFGRTPEFRAMMEGVMTDCDRATSLVDVVRSIARPFCWASERDTHVGRLVDVGVLHPTGIQLITRDAFELVEHGYGREHSARTIPQYRLTTQDTDEPNADEQPLRGSAAEDGRYVAA